MNTHSKLVLDLCKPGVDILASLTSEKAHALHMLLGLQTELGEFADCYKKHIIYDQPLDLDNALEEAGDLLFYFKGMLQSIGVTISDIEQVNLNKLTKRYPKKKYSNKDAKERKDKA